MAINESLLFFGNFSDVFMRRQAIAVRNRLYPTYRMLKFTLVRYHVRTQNISQRIEIRAVVWIYVKHTLGSSVLPPDVCQIKIKPVYSE